MAAVQANQESARLRALYRYEILDTEAEVEFDNLTRLAAQLCQVPMAAINFADASRLWFKSKIGWDVTELPRDVEFCGSWMGSENLLMVGDIQSDDRFCAHPLIDACRQIRFYAGVPLMTPAGHTIGVLCVADTVPRKLRPEQIEALQILSRQVMHQLEMRRNLWVMARQNSDRLAAEAEIRFQAHLLNTVEQSVIATDLHGRITYWNLFAEKLYGWSAAEALGSNVVEIVPAQMSKEQAAEIMGCLKQGESWSGEFVVQRKDGTTFPALVTDSPIRNSQGELVGIVGISRDISAQVAADALVKQQTLAIAQREKMLQNVLNTIPVGVWILDRQGNILQGNKAAQKIWGMDRQLWENNLTHYSFYGWQTGSNNPIKSHEWGVFRAIEQGETCLNETIDIQCFDGTRKTILNSAIPLLNDSQEIIGAIVIDQDITEQQLVEKAFWENQLLIQRIADATPAILYVYDLAEEHSLYTNSRVCDILGYTPREIQAMGSELFPNLLHPGDRDKFASHRKQLDTVKDGEILELEYRLRHANGEWRWLHSRATAFSRSPEGLVRQVLGVASDITDKKKLEAQFLRTQRLESIGTLAGGIAHDLNNILAPILMAVQLLEKRMSDATSQRVLKTLETNAKRGGDLVKQILSFARGIEANRTIIQVRHLIAEIQQIAKETFPKSLEVHTNIPRDLWTLCGDATQLHQVLINLCVNARDAMPQGGSLSITAENIAIDDHYAKMNLGGQVGSYVVITIADTGIGIPEEIQDRIFEPFFTTKELGKGTGLGLATVRGIVKSHGGFVQIFSEVGKGTQFKIFLPAVLNPETEEKQASFNTLLGGKGELILVVDDEAAIREITKETLETYTYRVLTASDGIEAIALYAQNRQNIGAVLIDMMMPSMDGITTIKMLQKMNPSVKIIAVSGLGVTYQLSEAEIAVSEFLSKPYTAKDLLKTIHHAIAD